jgi:Cys-tRNA(Pro)/Cys-tRNA(Cys) deacylase
LRQKKQQKLKKMSPKKTNALRILDEAGIDYTTRSYTVDESDLSAISVAKKLGLEASQTFKTLVAKGEQTGVLLACIPGDAQLDLKALARSSGNKRVEMVPLKDVFDLTGYVRGGVSPLGLKKNFPFFLDELALVYDEISISAGVRGLQIVLNPEALVALTAAITGDLCRFDL